jgi:GNAT superfamily N-acetyltransferase
MQVRIATTADYPQLLRLYQQLNPEDPVAGASVRTAFDAILQSPALELIVAEKDGVLVGSCYLNIIPNMTRAGQPYAVIENVITDAAYRKQGIGKAVMNFAVELAGRAGCYKVMLMTGRKDDGVNAFYVNCGFSKDAKQAFIRRLS